MSAVALTDMDRARLEAIKKGAAMDHPCEELFLEILNHIRGGNADVEMIEMAGALLEVQWESGGRS
ncbi:hypothetical protein I6F35_35465 [Bradyrhizobium sp. BRP22]|uniref:hypothetical protein n=1 Tax=Bradyrhizobium sp. BRP22 TaxID=2793821 RepID=UPI001CD46BF8|nr:hypothetical protein [Bradyrhizobium sp. BRP22]MCA1458413.1 hypothetical protein [Bradyrhizobium sp. BRP22]